MTEERIYLLSMNKYGSDGVPFTGNVAEITPAEQQLQQIIDALVPVVQQIIDALVPTLENCVEAVSKLWDDVLKAYPDNRVVWLAYHSKKRRVRKKNRNRIVRYFKKAVNCSDQSGTESGV